MRLSLSKESGGEIGSMGDGGTGGRGGEGARGRVGLPTMDGYSQGSQRDVDCKFTEWQRRRHMNEMKAVLLSAGGLQHIRAKQEIAWGPGLRGGPREQLIPNMAPDGPINQHQIQPSPAPESQGSAHPTAGGSSSRRCHGVDIIGSARCVPAVSAIGAGELFHQSSSCDAAASLKGPDRQCRRDDSPEVRAQGG
ncbi:unnamed protein product [Pleuronectes platessa]|uniref:Uncharacterized protein n=1 Tax=Pleuronectes platessa TaxID=8262 RepID=A0A9N7YN71_PLEPL|nr:unnamed protein product [Pleuronectes platessa]